MDDSKGSDRIARPPWVAQCLALGMFAGLLVGKATPAEFSLPDFKAPSGFSLPESLQFHGFASQGYIWTSGNKFFGDSDGGGTFDFRDLGINASWQVLPQLLLSLQGVAHWAGESDDGAPRLDYGLVDYAVFTDIDDLWGVRLGRVVNPIGFYNDTRDVAFTRPSILLPQSIYFDSARALFLSGDGSQIYGERRTKLGDLSLQFNTVFTRVGDPETEQELFQGDAAGELSSVLSYIGRLMYEYNQGQVRLGLTGILVPVDYVPGGTDDPLQAGTFTFTGLVFSSQYNAEDWSLTAEYARRAFDFKDFGPVVPDTDFVGESYYIQALYRFTPKWQALLRYDVLFGDTDDREGRKFEAQTGFPRHRRFAKDFTVGLRWDIARSIMLSVEYHNIDGTGWLPFVENPNITATERHWELLAFLVSYRF